MLSTFCPSPAALRARARWLPRASGAVCLSLLAHGAAAVTAGTIVKLRGPVSFAPALLATPVSLTEIELVPAPVASTEPEGIGDALRPAVPRPATPLEHQTLATARARAHASGSRKVPAATAAEPPRVVAATVAPGDDESRPPRFAMAVGTIGNVASAASPGHPGSPAAPASAGDAGSASAGDVLPEGKVTVRAQLLSSSPLLYPLAARRAEVEADLPLEIVVDLDGRVLAARVLRPAGYGLDEQAVRAVRAYRFSPARRDGRPVRVRMPWTVQFRLR